MTKIYFINLYLSYGLEIYLTILVLHMTNSTKTTKISSIFLAAILVAGTITAISPSFIIKGVNAQGDSYYGMDSYGYSDYRDDKDKKYDSYGPPVYGMDDSYDKKPVYGMDDSHDDRKSYDKESYGNDNSYKPQYLSSYKPDSYKPAYPSYGKDDRDKSKDSNKSVSINKLNCININLNINGNNTGNISIGNKGQVPTAYAEEGYSGAYSSGGERYYDGYDNKQDKGFDCIINNNNNNTNVVSGEAGNVTDGNVIEITCEECFEENLSAQTFVALNAALTSATGVTITIGGQT